MTALRNPLISPLARYKQDVFQNAPGTRCDGEHA